jgi:methyltransferase-like protein
MTLIYFVVFQKVNEYQAKIKDTTRKMMAMVSELSMNQANAMKLQQTVKGQEQQLERAYLRMERGEAPTEDAEREWFRIIREEQQRQLEKEETQQVRTKDFNFSVLAYTRRISCFTY